MTNQENVLMIIRHLSKHAAFLSILLFLTNQSFSQVSTDSLKKHVYFLASDSLEGRHAGLRGGEIAAGYLAETFKSAGFKPLGKDYYHSFPLAPYQCNNIICVIEGSDPSLKDEYILLGAHYDHIGWKLNDDSIKSVFNGADDNASGTAAIIEVGRILAANSHLLKRSVIIAAFDAEESGLKGSEYFVKHPPVDLTKIKLMMSIDMVGMLKKNGKVVFTGGGSFNGGTDFMNKIKKVDGLNAEFASSSILWKDRTDTRPFYDSGIPCLFVTTGSHPAYHKPEDDAEAIDYEGLSLISNQVYYAAIALSSKDNFEFEQTRETVRAIESGFKLGIGLGYNNNYHKYSEGPYLAKSLSGFTGGLVTQIQLSDIWALQPEFLYSYYGSESGAGDIRLHSVEVPLKLMLITPPHDVRSSVFLAPYVNYIFKGYINNNTIDFKENKINQLDWGLQLGFGLEILNIQMQFTGKYGLSNFYKDKVPGFGKATNSTFTISLNYFFLP